MSTVTQQSRAGRPSHEVRSEIAYDLLQDHLDVVLALLEGPVAEQELVRRLGSSTTLERFLRHGLVRRDEDGYRAVASIYHQMRQEGMVSFLERCVLPALTAGLGEDDGGFATLRNVSLSLPPGEALGLRAGAVQRLVESLAEITDRPATGTPSRLTVLVVGTSKIDVTHLGPGIDAGERALCHLQKASLQRSSADKAMAVLTQVAGLADASRYGAAMAAVDAFTADLEERWGVGGDANYHVTVASHWRDQGLASRGGQELC